MEKYIVTVILNNGKKFTSRGKFNEDELLILRGAASSESRYSHIKLQLSWSNIMVSGVQFDTSQVAAVKWHKAWF